MFSSEAWLANTGANFYNSVATQSLRLDNSASSLLTRTPSAGDRKTWVWSAWIKRCDTDRDQDFFTAEGSGTQLFSIIITDSNKIQIYGASAVLLLTNQVLRDTSAWYHIAIASDTTQTTASNRLKLYLNGSEVTSFATDNRASYAQDTDYGINSNVKHNIGSNQAGGNFGHYYIAEVNFVDGLSFFSDTSGTANTSFNIDSFGETKNGVWIPKRYIGSYGTQGFHLEFKQTGDGSVTASSTTIGADTANSNHYKDTNLDSYDSNMPDSVENNFCTLNPLDNVGSILSEGNLKSASTSNSWKDVRSTFVMPSGSWYVEMLSTSGIGNGNIAFGIVPQSNALPSNNFFGSQSNSWQYTSNGNWYNNNGVGGSGATFSVTGSSRDIVGMSFDGSTLKFYKNNSLQITIGSIPTNDYAIGISVYDTDEQCILNFGQDSSFAGNKTAQGNTDDNGIGDFYYAPPSGFLALCTSNLEEPTISPNSDNGTADDYFNTVIYPGNGYPTSNGQTVSGVGFQSDFTWIKDIDRDGYNHYLFDSIRGATKVLRSNVANLEGTEGTALTSWNEDGFVLGANNEVNYENDDFVSWNWKAGGTASTIAVDSVSTGVPSIASSVSANTTSGFSVVTYTGNDASSATVGHGLLQAPELIIVKNRDEAITNPAWVVYHASNTSAPATQYLDLSGTGGTDTASTLWNDVPPSATVVTLGTADSVLSGSNHVMYCFHSVEGYSKFGSYTGNNDPDGNMIFTNFAPALVIIKYVSGSAGGNKHWYMWDNKRSPQNVNDNTILANESHGETDDSSLKIDFLSNGFKLRNAEGAVNNGAEYIYMCWAETPFKYATAR